MNIHSFHTTPRFLFLIPNPLVSSDEDYPLDVFLRKFSHRSRPSPANTCFPLLPLIKEGEEKEEVPLWVILDVVA